MKVNRGTIARHLFFIVGLTALLVLGIITPFLPGRYDRLAVPLSTMVQVSGLVGLPLTLVGLLWLLAPRHRFIFAVVSLIMGTMVALILVLFATLSVGNVFGLLTIALWSFISIRLVARLKQLRSPVAPFNPVPLYLVALPLFTFLVQLVLAAPFTQWSRNRTMANADEFIRDIELHQAQHRQYPVSLQAQNKDYYPNVVGIEKYVYVPQGRTYNLSFEQPRFLLDRFGTREWVVYNPFDQHRVYSHIAWLMSASDEIEPSQGWYANGETGQPHWKYFLFD